MNKKKTRRDGEKYMYDQNFFINGRKEGNKEGRRERQYTTQVFPRGQSDR